MRKLSFLVCAAVSCGTLSARTLTVSASGGGDFTTISAAAEVAGPGDVVLVEPGLYREEVRVQRSGREDAPVVFRSRVRGKAVIRGSEEWRTGWRRLGDATRNVWAGEIDRAQFSVWTNSPYMRTVSIGPRDASRLSRPVTNAVVTADSYMPRTLGQIFVDGDPMTEVESVSSLLSTPDTWMVSQNGAEIWLHPAETRPEPALCLVEWSVRNRCFGAERRGFSDIVVDGFTVEHCANQAPFPQIGAIDARTGVRWTIENCTVRHAKSVGISCGNETWAPQQITDMPPEDRRLMWPRDCIVRYNTVTDCGVSGIAAIAPRNLAIYNNTIMRCSNGGYGKPEEYWDETAGIKIHGAPVVVANNLIMDNDGHGIWFDTGFTDVRCTGNYIANNRRSGVMFEACGGHAICDHNIIVGTRTDSNDYFGGDGIYSHDGGGVTVAHNLLAYNHGAGVRFRTLYGTLQNGEERNTSHNRYVNNIFCCNAGGELMIASTNRLSLGTVSSGNVYLVMGGHPGFEGALMPFRITYYNQGGRTWEELYEKCREAGAGAMGFDEWVAMGHPLGIEAWRKLQGLDLDSRVIRAFHAMELAPHGLSVRFLFPKELYDCLVPAIDGPLSDYEGAAYPKPGAPVRPGPFQRLDWQEDGVYRALRPPILNAAPTPYGEGRN